MISTTQSESEDVPIHICKHLHTHATYIDACSCAHACAYACMHIRTYVHTFAYIFVHVHKHTHTHTHTHVYAHAHKDTCVHIERINGYPTHIHAHILNIYLIVIPTMGTSGLPDIAIHPKPHECKWYKC